MDILEALKLAAQLGFGGVTIVILVWLVIYLLKERPENLAELKAAWLARIEDNKEIRGIIDEQKALLKDLAATSEKRFQITESIEEMSREAGRLATAHAEHLTRLRGDIELALKRIEDRLTRLEDTLRQRGAT